MGKTDLTEKYNKMRADALDLLAYAERGIALLTQLKNSAAHLESEANAVLTELGGSRGRGRKVELTEEQKLLILNPNKKPAARTAG